MKMKTGDVLVYRDSEASLRYGTGVVTSITTEEYSILWARRERDRSSQRAALASWQVQGRRAFQ